MNSSAKLPRRLELLPRVDMFKVEYIRSILAFALLLLVRNLPCSADELELVSDFNADSADLYPSDGVFAAGRYYFSADEGRGQELFTFKAGEQVHLLKKIREGDVGSNPSHLTPYGADIYFYADDGIAGRELWHSDGTEFGTHMVADIAPGAASGIPDMPSAIIVMGDTVYFVANDGNGAEVWRSDGSVLGTMPILRINGEGVGSNPENLILAGNKIFFTAVNAGGEGLWSSDGTASGTNLVFDLRSDSSSAEVEMLAADESLTFFWADDGVHGRELWRSDGTAGGTFILGDINPSGDAAIVNVYASPGGVIADGRFFFAAQDPSHGAELWVSDGSVLGTYLCAEFMAGPAGSFPATYDLPQIKLIPLAGKLFVYHAANIVPTVSSINTSDCSIIGNTFLSDAVQGVIAGGAIALLTADSILSEEDPYGRDMQRVGLHFWDGVSNATQVTTALGAGFLANNVFFTNQRFEFLRTHLFPTDSQAGFFAFAMEEGVWSSWLWNTDGTPIGTTQIASLVSAQSRDAFVQALTPSSDGVLAVMNNGANPLSHLVKVPNASGISPEILIQDVNRDSFFGGVREIFQRVFSFAGKSWLTGTDELVYTDGTPAGSGVGIQQMSIVSGSIFQPVEYRGGIVFFGAEYGESIRLKISDGTQAGTRDFLPPEVQLQFDIYAEMYGLQIVSDKVLFRAQTDELGSEFWISDGSAAGTSLLKDINPGPNSSLLESSFFLSFATKPAAMLNGVLYFFADDGVHGSELWKTDGTTAGTQLVKDIIPGSDSPVAEKYVFILYELLEFEGALYFVGDDSNHSTQLWKSDGTAQGTVQVALPAYDPIPQNLTVVGDELFFTAGLGSEKWLVKTNGSPEYGSAIYVAPISDPFFGFNNHLCAHRGMLYFVSQDSFGKELWRSDGTWAGTQRVTDLSVGAADSLVDLPYGAQIVSNGEKLFFVAKTPEQGSELWRLSASQLDLCPSDGAKVVPGQCGCGIRDQDSDYDGVPDCLDLCPHDYFKLTPGACGCGAADYDYDDDGTPDCSDLCPYNAGLTQPTACGCTLVCPNIPPPTPQPTPLPGENTPEVEISFDDNVPIFTLSGPAGAKFFVEIRRIPHKKQKRKRKTFRLVLSSEVPSISAPSLRHGLYRARTWYVLQAVQSRKSAWQRFTVPRL